MRLNNSCSCKDCQDVPVEVIKTINNYFKDNVKENQRVNKELGFDHIMKCYHFNFAGMFIGVEKDGYMHS